MSGATVAGPFSAPFASAPLLSAAIAGVKLDSIAAKDPAKPDVFYGALYFAGTQLLVISAQYAAPAAMAERITKKDFREAYLDLSSASVPGSKVFVEDLGANGLIAKPKENEAFDASEAAGKRTTFDGDWKKQQLSEDDYAKIFQAADEDYSRILEALIAQVKKTS